MSGTGSDNHSGGGIRDGEPSPRAHAVTATHFQPTSSTTTTTSTTAPTPAPAPARTATTGTTPPSEHALSTANPPPKTNRVRWHGNTDLAPSRVHAAAVAAAAAAAAGHPSKDMSRESSAPASAAITPAVAPSHSGPIFGARVPAVTVQDLTSSSTQGAAFISDIDTADNDAAQTIAPKRVIRANHPGPLMLKQRLSDTGVPGVGYNSDPHHLSSGAVVANATATLAEQRRDGAKNKTVLLAPPDAAVPSSARAAAAAVKPSILSAARQPAVVQSPLPQNINYAARELDEQGMDDAAFQQLKEQLQLEAGRGGLPASALGAASARHQRATAAANGRNYQHQHQQHRRTISAMSSGNVSGATSGASTPYSTDSSYDPAADSDLEHIDLIEGEVDGMPARLSKRQKQRIREAEDEEREMANAQSGWAKLRNLMKARKGKDAEAEEGGAGSADADAGLLPSSSSSSRRFAGFSAFVSSSSAPARADAELDEKRAVAHDDDDGPTNLKSVPVTTSSGTRGGAGSGFKRKPTKHEREAARLVRAHKLVSSQGHQNGPMPALPGKGGLEAFVAGFHPGVGGGARHRHHHHAHRSDDEGDTDDDERPSRSSSPELELDPRPVATSGVLGNLLRLYEAQNAAAAAAANGSSLGDASVAPSTLPSQNPSLTSLLEPHTTATGSEARAGPVVLRGPAGQSRLRTSHLAADTPDWKSPVGPGASEEQESHAQPAAAAVEQMSPEALAAAALAKERRQRVREIEARLRRTLGAGGHHHRRGRSGGSGGGGGSSSLAGLMSSEFKRHSQQQQQQQHVSGARTPRRSSDALSIASSAGGTAVNVNGSSAAGGGGGGGNGGSRRPMIHSISASAFPISAAVIEKTQQSGRAIGKAASSAARVAASETGLDAAMDERPKAARNAGGVIGALIATTGNLVGAVSPHLAQLGPNPRRAGYTLDRYLLPEMNAKTLRQTAEIIADAAPRRSGAQTPTYWSRSTPGTPMHITPPSGGGGGGESGSRSRSRSNSRGGGANGLLLAADPSAVALSAYGSAAPDGGSGTQTHSQTLTGGSTSPTKVKGGGGGGTDGTNSPTMKEKTLGFVGGGGGAEGNGPAEQQQQQPSAGARSFAAGMRSMPPTPGGGGLRSRSSHALLHLPGVHSAGNIFHRAWSGLHSGVNTPEGGGGGGDGGGGGAMDYFSPKGGHGGGGAGAGAATSVGSEDWEKMEWQRKLKRRQKKRKKEEIFITLHVAAILQRQEFLLKLARALMMFGAPTHKIESQIQHTARVLETNCRVIYLPNLMLLSFGDETTRTSETKFIKQTASLDLTKLTDMHDIYWNVVRDKISVTEASEQLDELMRRKPLIPRIPTILVGGFASAFICVGAMGFGGSFLDALAAFPLGCFLVYCQSIVTTELYSNVFEIVFCVINSFIAAALHSTGIFCYSAVVSGSIVLILPGFIVLSGALELQSKNLIAGSVRLVYALIYSLFLGLGLSIGVDFWTLVRNKPLDNASYCDLNRHDPDIWYRRNVELAWAFLTVPGYSMVLSLRNQAKVTRKEFPMMVIIACAGWACNHFASRAQTLSGRQDITSALGSLAVGFLANLYGRFGHGRAFVVAVPGILYQLPSGLSNGGLLNFVDTTSNPAASTGKSSFSNSGFSVAASLIQVGLGLTVGLFAATILSHYLTLKRHRRTNNAVFSF